MADDQEINVSRQQVQVGEQTFVSNPFGTVTDKRVTYFRSKGWFSGGSREDIPLQHVTSVRLDISRNIVGGIFALLIGLGLMFSHNGVAIFLGLLLVGLAVLLFWGSPAVVVNTAGRDLNAAKGLPWHRAEASQFVEALRGQLFRN